MSEIKQKKGYEASQAIVRVKDLVFSYPNYAESENSNTQPKKVLNGVCVTVPKGQFVAVLGQNGSGKSTLAKQLNALLLPESGTVYVKNWNTKEEENLFFIRQNMGMVFQNPDNQMVATMVEEDVAFGPENLGVLPEQIKIRVDEALQAVGMEDYKNHSIHFLSGGQKQRVAIAGALAMKPSCIVLDEPTAMLDPVGRFEVLETVLHLNQQENMSVVWITHFMDEAAKAQRVLVMDEGNIALNGTPKEVFANVDLLKTMGLDVPSMAEIAHKLRKNGMDLPQGILTIEEMVGALCQMQYIPLK